MRRAASTKISGAGLPLITTLSISQPDTTVSKRSVIPVRSKIRGVFLLDDATATFIPRRLRSRTRSRAPGIISTVAGLNIAL